MIPFIVLLIQLCSTGWCAQATVIMNFESKEKCDAWAKDSFVAGENKFYTCAQMPGWQEHK